MNATISVKDISRGNMPMSRLLPKTIRTRLVSAVATSFVDSNDMRSMVAKAPNVAPAAKVATVVTVVVIVEIISLKVSDYNIIT